ncbi:MAG: peptidoglycan editing factor PgeF [Bacteroidota bacterium]
MKLIKPTWVEQFPGLTVAQTTRAGGVSKPPYSSLNFSVAVGDRPAEVQNNHQILADTLGFEVDNMAGGHQVHGASIAHVDQGGRYDGFDAFVTSESGLLLGVTVADCVPVLIVDHRLRAVAAVHAGWRGTVARIASKTLQYMCDQFGTEAADCWAFVGAAIGYEDYEVGPEVAEHFDTQHKRKKANAGKHLVDLKGANRSQLAEAGIPQAQIEVCPISTYTHSDLIFSHRAAAGQANGRGLAVIGYQNSLPDED